VQGLELPVVRTPRSRPDETVEFNPATSSGAAVASAPSAVSSVHARRTVVAALVAALGAFALTALFMTRNTAPESTSVSNAGVFSSLARASDSAPQTASASAEAWVVASDAGVVTADASVEPTSVKDQKPRVTGAYSRLPTARRAPSAAATGTTGVARGLKLVTEP
jgi:hypothetical protein